MSPVQSLLLGVLQGVAEFLPVSSSGHLILLRVLMKLTDVPLLYDVLLHVSTLLVMVIVFRRRIGAIFAALWRGLAGKKREADGENLRLALYILAATVVTGAVGVLLSRFEPLFSDRPRLVCVLFLVTAVILCSTLLRRGSRGYLNFGLGAVLLVGLAQGLGVLPGISRSGITIAAALLLGLDRSRAGEFSFLIAIPAILGALALQLREAGTLLRAVAPPVLLLGFAASFLVGLVSLLLLLRIVKRGRLAWFSAYLVPVAAAGLILL